ncbi:MAG TPA: CBS domain-containing protein, partial [Thiopseudomonas sp.]|nr:CBS domain-containing protein [Thiopseudomonas sp.]
MSNTHNNLALVLSDAIQSNNFDNALAAIKSLHSVDLADVLEQLEPSLAWRLLERLPERAEVFTFIEPEQQVRLAREFPRATLAKLVSEMPADERTDLFKRFDQNQRDLLLPALAHAEREDIRKLSEYVEGTAGALMTSDYATLKKDMTVAQAMAYLRDEAPDAETIYQAYIVSDKRKLLGEVSLRDLILADLNKSIQDLMISDVVHALVTDDQEDIAKKIARYDLLA